MKTKLAIYACLLVVLIAGIIFLAKTKQTVTGLTTGIRSYSYEQKIDSDLDIMVKDTIVTSETDTSLSKVEMLGFPVDYDYVIVVSDRLITVVAPLAEWKQKKGLKTRIVPLSYIGVDPSFEDIYDYIKNIYETSTTPIKYLLLAGDVTDIPPHYRSRDWIGEPDDDDWVVSDRHYGIMIDLVAAEEIDGEFLPEEMHDIPLLEEIDVEPFPEINIYVGRFPASTPEAMEVMVQKTLSYEREPNMEESRWFSRAFLLGGEPEVMGYAHWDANCELVYTPRIPSDADVLEELGWEVDCLAGPPSYETVPIINEGVSLVFTYGHGTPNRVVGFDISGPDMTMLNNGSKLPLWISGCCNNGRFDNETHNFITRAGRLYENERCFAEVLLEIPDRGIVAFIGCSRTGGYGYHYYFVDGCAEELSRGTGRLGPILEAGKRRAYNESIRGRQWECNNERTRQYTREHINLLGDPELSIYTKRPHRFNVRTARSPELFTRSSYVPVHGATVCLRRDGNQILVQETDEEGFATFELTHAWESFDITVTKKNFIPYSEVHHIMRFMASQDNLGKSNPTIVIKVEDLDVSQEEISVDPHLDKEITGVFSETQKDTSSSYEKGEISNEGIMKK